MYSWKEFRMSLNSMRKYWRIAIASLDDKVINEHFGRAKEFQIVDIMSDGTWEFMEKRTVKPLCNGGEHSEQALELLIGELGDCTAVLVARIGAAARRALELNHIAVFEQPDYIDVAINKLTEYFIKTNYNN